MKKNEKKRTRPKQIHKKSEKMRPEQILTFLQDYSAMIHGKDMPTQLISMRVPKNILELFKLKSKSQNLKYQTHIVALMREWIRSN